MAENNEVTVKQPEVKKSSFGAACKEFFRKRMVALKRKPQNIAFLFVIVTTIFYLLVLGTASEPIVGISGPDWAGLLVFVNTLLSLLVVVTFTRSFPKMKKPPKKTKNKDGSIVYKESKATITLKERATKININIPMIVLTFVMLIAMLVCEIVYRRIVGNHCWTAYVGKTDLEDVQVNYYNLFTKSLRNGVVHMVLLALSIFVTALIPLYTKLLVRIDTSKKIEGAVENMQEIDLADDE